MSTSKNSCIQYVFGPVPSRRLGRSLGIDLVPYKTCSYDCIYCELGRTTRKTVKRKEFVPLKEIIKEIETKINQNIHADYITLAGSGEPTLHTKINKLISYLKNATDIPVAVLTNGSLLWKDEVKRDLEDANLVIPSLDANNSINFNCINRPHHSISFETMINGISDFSKEFKGMLYLEVFFLGGITAIDADVMQMAQIVNTIRTDKIQLNTVARPPAEDFAYGATTSEMNRFVGYFRGKAEVIADFRETDSNSIFIASGEDVLNLLKRRPCTIQDISKGLSMHINEAIKYVNPLLISNCICKKNISGKEFYCVSKKTN